MKITGLRKHYIDLVYGDETATITYEETIEENAEAICSYFKIISREGKISVDEEHLQQILTVLIGRSVEHDGEERREMEGKELSITYSLNHVVEMDN